MKTFSGLSEKDKKTNRIFCLVFLVFFALSLFAAFTTPEEIELSSMAGTLESFKCVIKENSKGSSQWLEVAIAREESQRTFTYSERCKGEFYPFEKGMEVIAQYAPYGLNEALYSLTINGERVVSFKESSTRHYTMPIGAIFVFGLPWGIWFFVKVARS